MVTKLYGAAPSRSRTARGCGGASRRSGCRGRSPDKPDEALVRASTAASSAPPAQGDVPFDRIGQGVQLPEVDVVDAHPVQDRCSSSRAPAAVRSSPLVARKNRPGSRASHGRMRTSARRTPRPRPDGSPRGRAGRPGLVRDPLETCPRAARRRSPGCSGGRTAELCLFDGTRPPVNPKAETEGTADRGGKSARPRPSV